MTTINISGRDVTLCGLDVIASEAGVGKSALALGMASRMAREGRNVAIFSLEMNEKEQLTRLFSAMSGVPASTIRERSLKEEELTKVQAALEEYKQWAGSLLVLDENYFSLSKIQSTLRDIKENNKIDVAIVDRFELVKERLLLGGLEDELCYISRELKKLSSSLGIPIIVLATASPKRKKDTYSLRGSLAADADIILFLERREKLASLKVVKNRYGKCGESMPLEFDAEHVCFKEV